MNIYYWCTSLFIAEGKIHTTTWVACFLEEIKVLSHSGIEYVKIYRTVVDWHAESIVSNKFKFPCENRKTLRPLLDSNQDVADALLLYGNKNMGNPNFLEVMFHYFCDKIITNLLKLMKSPITTNKNNLA